MLKFLFSGFFIGIGLAAFASGAELMQVWIISGVAGIPTAFKVTRRSREQRIMDNIHDRYEKDIINLMFGWLDVSAIDKARIYDCACSYMRRLYLYSQFSFFLEK